MLFVENVMPTLNSALSEGRRIALVTLVGVDGSSPRPLGSQLGVVDGGRCVGLITGGCAEKAIVAEALRCIDNQENKLVQYGAGSPYMDVVLPCGSKIELYIETQRASEIVRTIHAQLLSREPAAMAIDVSRLTSHISETTATHDRTVEFTVNYQPDYRIFAFGEGANLVSFCKLAQTAGITVAAYSPDKEALDFLREQNVTGHNIYREYDFNALAIDEQTAIVTLFHEHEWESALLHAALNSRANYIGALGSRMTHKQRLAFLAGMPPARRRPDIIHGPVGLDIGAENPNEIAVSIIAEIIANRRRRLP